MKKCQDSVSFMRNITRGGVTVATVTKTIKISDAFRAEIKEFQRELGMTGREYGADPEALRIGVTLGTQYLRYVKKVLPVMKPANLDAVLLKVKVENADKWKASRGVQGKKVVPKGEQSGVKVIPSASQHSEKNSLGGPNEQEVLASDQIKKG